MPQSPPAPPSLEVLRKEIDASDEQVHNLLMARGDIIDRLISVKQTQEVGSAFRPAREADMMRRLVQRHRGILPLDTVESIWRVIISTFTYVQAPFSVHADISLGESAMRDSARFHFGFTVPYLAHFSAPAAVEAAAKSKGDLALVSATSSRRPWVVPLGADRAPQNPLYGAPERGGEIVTRRRYSGVEDVPPRAESRHSRNCALHPGQEPGARAGPQGVQALGQRDPVRAFAEGDRRLQGGRGAPG